MGVLEHAHYDEIDLDEMTVSLDGTMLNYPCPCGDTFELALERFVAGASDVAQCPTCSLTIRIKFTKDQLEGLIRKHPHALIATTAVVAA